MGDDSNSATVRNVALGFVAVLAPIFVIWRERIASGKAASDRYEKAVQMLGDPNLAICVAGIGVIEELGHYPTYKKMGLAVLSTFVEDPTPSRSEQPSSVDRKTAVGEAERVIKAWGGNVKTPEPRPS